MLVRSGKTQGYNLSKINLNYFSILTWNNGFIVQLPENLVIAAVPH
jgi:hypothetical protein